MVGYIGCGNILGMEEVCYLGLTEVKTKVYHKVCLPLAKWEVMFVQVATRTCMI